MSASDPGLVVVHYFRKLDIELLHKQPSCDEAVRFYKLVETILRGYGIHPKFHSDHTIPIRARQLGVGENDRWKIKAYELENDIVILAKFKRPIPVDLPQQLRTNGDFNAYKAFFEEELTGILYDHVSDYDVDPIWRELISLSPSTQQTTIFDLPTEKEVALQELIDQSNRLRPTFSGCLLSPVGEQDVFVGRLVPVEVNAGHRRECLWAVYPNKSDSNSEYTQLVWTPYATNALPYLVRYLCNLTRCTCSYDSAMQQKRRLEKSQMALWQGPHSSNSPNEREFSLQEIQKKVLNLVRSRTSKRSSLTEHDLEEVSHQLDAMLSSDLYNEVNQSLPELSRYSEHFETWHHDATALFGGSPNSNSRLSFINAELSRLEGYRVGIRSAIGHTRANMEKLERSLRGVDSMMSSLSLRMAERRNEVEEKLANRFHLLEIFVIGFYTIYLSYMLHSWSHDDMKKSADIARAFFLVTMVLSVLVLAVSRKLISLDALLILGIVGFSCVFAFVLVGCIDVSWSETWKTLPYFFRVSQ